MGLGGRVDWGVPSLARILGVLLCVAPLGCQAEQRVSYEELTTGFEIPGAIAVIGERELLIADRARGLFHYREGELVQVTDTPALGVMDTDLVLGGLLDVSLHPEFATNRQVYLAYVTPELNGTVARFELIEDRAESFEVLWSSEEFPAGMRLAWPEAEHFFFSFGAGGFPTPDPGPQDPSVDLGKIHRLRADGQIPADNPVFEGAAGPSSVWSYGHRNPQGLTWVAAEQALYANEHGPKGGDELNRIIAGGNYGWPLFSYGLNYDDTPVSDLSEDEAAEFSIMPLAYWTPDFRVAPSGLLQLDDSAFRRWEGSFLMGALNPEHLLRYDPSSGETEIVAEGIGRVRDVAQLPSGELVIAIDASDADEGRVLRLYPS